MWHTATPSAFFSETPAHQKIVTLKLYTPFLHRQACMLHELPFLSSRCLFDEKNLQFSNEVSLFFQYFHIECKHCVEIYSGKVSLNSKLFHWPAFLKLFQTPRRKVHHSDSFFPAEYEYVNHFFLARQDSPKLYVKDLKITLNSCF